MTSLRADVLVIGAGIVGAACAYRLAREGLRVTVLEGADAPATGSTARSAAGVRVQFQDETNVRLSMLSAEEYRAMPEADYRDTGYLMLVPQERWAAHREGAALQRSLGCDVRLLTPQEAREIVDFDPGGVEGCSYAPGDGAVDPHGITMRYLRDARSLGASVLLGAPVTEVRLADGEWALTTPRGSFHAPVVVNATGAWAREVGRLAGLDLPVTPARRMVYCSAPTDHEHRHPMTFDLVTGLWARSEGRRVIFGLANPRDTGFKGGVDWTWLDPTLEVALARFPWFAELRLDRAASWFGHYELTPDGRPVVGEMPGAPGWFNACGFSGHGVMHAAAVGRVVALDVTGQTLPVDLTSLRAERFERGGVLAGDIQL